VCVLVHKKTGVNVRGMCVPMDLMCGQCLSSGDFLPLDGGRGWFCFCPGFHFSKHDLWQGVT
jgi:hypothetical protein